ncbi:cytochrome P450 [Laetiporus sulphureus 93-53]|uniref:Cytochrome P450 n=1 Tax=Laetiporus sulphureus 93-53 TaxID=1314785 RepID=A0A165G927_9APHY|nr:cytochrome P450 [Laetiporus sulphureus 93-53]KZT10004.1 cytochrome P450 [Laetiporus sulphureus 93-53]
MAGRHTSPLPPGTCSSCCCLNPPVQLSTGPKPLPLVGNLFHLPAHRHCEEFTKWRLLYGDMVYMNIVGRKYIVLNSAGAAIELYDKRGSIYNTRPQTVMAADLVGRRNSFTLIPYGERYRTYKKYMHNALNHRAIADYWDSIDLESITFLQALSTTPEVFRSHVRRNIGAVALRIAYGYQVEDENDHFVALADELARITRDSLEPGRWLVDSLHWLRHIPSWMPGAQFKQWAQQACLKCEEFTDAPFAMVKRNVAKGHAIPSFTSKAMEGLPGKASDSSNAEAQDIIKHVAASIYAGGTDTTASLMTTFFLVMACYPEIQKKAQAEIDAVIGPTRLPSPSDEEYLPYVGYLIKELHRINPIVPLIPRTTLTDDVYRGFHIPKNSYIIANAWAITRDPEIYPQPEHFDPERTQPQMDPQDITFGLGRRHCLGVHLANCVAFTFIARTLAVFDILKPLDEAGLEYSPLLAFTAKHTSYVDCPCMEGTRI